MTPPLIRHEWGEKRTAILTLGGQWKGETARPSLDPTLKWLHAKRPVRMTYSAASLGQWDSTLLTALVKLNRTAETLGIEVDHSGLPQGIQGMIALSKAVPERQDAHRIRSSQSLIEMIGSHTLWLRDDFLRLADFVGEICLGFLGLLQGKSRLRGADLLSLIQECGPSALPIISLIGILMGMILAFVGAVQLKIFGAQVFIADLVGLGMAREMGAMMTAILMAGRTGSAFAAELGSMTINDEIDALKTTGFSPVDFLVLPRIIALFLTIPLLCIYADLLGIFGGAVVAASLFDVSFPEYLEQLNVRMRLIDFEVGIAKCAVFGILVAVAGCFRGLQCERNAAAVGRATTSAVVTGIVYIVVSDAVMTLIITALNLLRR